MARRHSWKVKALLFGISATLALLTLELGLRVAGSYYRAGTVTPRHEVDLSDATHRVLCVGDSFTFGGRVDRDETYPAHLTRVLQERAPSFRVQVLNQGVCEYNSWQLLNFYREWLEIYRPQTVVLLVGAANRFNPWGYDWRDDEGLMTRAGRWLGQLRVVKMLRWIQLNLSGRDITGRQPGQYGRGTFGVDGHLQGVGSYMRAKTYLKRMASLERAHGDSPLEDAWALFNRKDHAGALDRVKLALNQGKGSAAHLRCAAGYFTLHRGDYAGAEARYKEALAKHPQSAFVADQAAYFYSNAGREMMKAGKNARAIDFLFEAIKYNPDDEYMYYAMSKAFDRQSRYDTAKVLARCDELATQFPALQDNPKFTNHINMFKGKSQWDRRVKAWLTRDLERIVSLTREAGAELVVQTYPVDYPHANGPLSALATKHGLVLADQRAAFVSRVPPAEQSQFLFDDDHCTPRGHRLMAETVADVLLQKVQKR